MTQASSSETKHTPGLWLVDTEHNVRVIANDRRATIIAEVCGAKSNPSTMADARLIAAAPQLLAALRDMLALHLAHHNHPVHGAARAAIAAAEGR